MKKYFKILALASMVFSFGSCLKDKNYDNGLTGIKLDNPPKVIELGYKFSLDKSQTLGLDFVNSVVDASLVTVRLAANDPATEDITVVLDTTGTGAIITTKGDSNFNRLPSLYSLPATGFTVTIPKGKREVDLLVKTNASLYNPSAVYGINFKLKSVVQSGYVLSGNFNSFYTKLGAKNQYDGEYSCEFTNYHPTANPGYIGTTQIVHLVTTGPNTNKIYWPLADDFAAPSLLNGALNYFGSQSPEYTFNSVTNVVTVQNAFPGAVTFYTMNPGFNSRYDAVNKIVYANWGYNYVGGTFSAATSREWTQKMTYIGPR
ncbi:MAG: hypothetical protein ABL929_02605 [Ferruginibacter sp.]|nr:hypothetical protein [Ferruginibacter sp.]